MTSTRPLEPAAAPEQTEDPRPAIAPRAPLPPGSSPAAERAERLRVAIVQNRNFAKSCDFNFRMQLLALASEMETYLRTLISPPSEGEWE